MPPEKILAKYSFPHKKSWNRKFQTPQNPSIIPVILNPEYLPPPPPTLALGPGSLSFKYVK